MKDEMLIEEKKLSKLAKRISKTFALDEEAALALIYEEWELVEKLFAEHKKVKAVHNLLIEEIQYSYRIA